MCLLCLQATAGYSHYFEWLKPPDKEPLRTCISEMTRIVDARRTILSGEEGEGNPVITEDRLVFNGRGDDGHEPFVFPGATGPERRWPNVPAGFNSCKTAGKPYDEVITACLIVARDHFPRSVLRISTDGEWEADWAAGAALYSKVLQRTARNPLDHDTSASNDLPIATKNLLGLAVAGAVVLLLVKKLA